jgi:hypothetical protein
MTWPAGRHPDADDGYPPGVAGRAAPVPVPPGRGRWRLTVHRRRFSAGDNLNNTVLAELPAARGRRLERNWCQPAAFTFTIDSARPEAALIAELQTEIVAWRWREDNGQDWPMFAGPVTQSEDQLTEQSNTVTFTCHDYLAMLARRLYTAPTPWTFTQTDQDAIAVALIDYARQNPLDSTGATLMPGGYLPVQTQTLDPAGNTRSYSGVLRDRTYLGSSVIGDLFDQLAKIQGGFDYATVPVAGATRDNIQVYYPYQGQARTSPTLMYGSTVSALTRTVNSADYANYWRVLGNNGSSDPAAAQYYGEAYNADATGTTTGLWQSADNAADVNQTATLAQQAQGDLALSALQPVYTLTLRPGTYSYGLFAIGDTLPLIVTAGRLNVNTTVRVLGVTFDISDDAAEDVSVTVGRPPTGFADLLAANNRDVNALNRR